MKPPEISYHPENSVAFDPTEFAQSVHAVKAAKQHPTMSTARELPQNRYANESEKMWSFRHRFRAWTQLQEENALAGLSEPDPKRAEEAALATVAVLPLDFLGQINKQSFRREVRRRLEDTGWVVVDKSTPT